MSLIARLPAVIHRNGNEPAAMPQVDTVILGPSARKESKNAAKAAASAGWLPTPDQPTPEYFRLIDHQQAAAAQAAIDQYHDAQTGHLATMKEWLATELVMPPAAGAYGPEARRQAALASQFDACRQAAEQALAHYERNRESLAARLLALDHYRLARRHHFLVELGKDHQEPTKLAGIPDSATGPVALPEYHQDAIDTQQRLLALRPSWSIAR